MSSKEAGLMTYDVMQAGRQTLYILPADTPTVDPL